MLFADTRQDNIVIDNNLFSKPLPFRKADLEPPS